MSIEIVAIGDELLKGITVNTNAAFIGKQLLLKGYVVLRHTVLSDHPDFLEQGLREALSRSSLVITTGGLGSTCDDGTREAAAKIFSSDFHTDHHIEEELKKRYGDVLKSSADQARVPTKARLLKNNIGTASGLIFSEKGSTLVLLPGVPQEMRPMFTNELLPLLPEYLKGQDCYATEILCFGPLIEEEVDPLLRSLKARYPSVDFGIYPGYGLLTVRLSSIEGEALNICKREISAQFSKFLYQSEEGKIEQAVQELFIKKGYKLGLAESCTGGQLAAKITSCPGASAYFTTSLVTYSNEMKKRLLGVSEETLQKHGAVSREVVIEMAEGLLKLSDVDVGVAISGIAGPDGGSPEKPVGTIYLAIAERNSGTKAICLRKLRGNREIITLGAVHRALFLLYQYLSHPESFAEWEGR